MNNNLKAVIKESGYKQKHICEKLGCKESALSHVISDRRKPNQKMIRDLSRVLHTSVISMFPDAKKIIYWKL